MAYIIEKKLNRNILLHSTNYDLKYHRFTEAADLNWFTKTMGRVIGEECGEMYVSYIESTHYFVDFLRYSIHEKKSRDSLPVLPSTSY